MPRTRLHLAACLTSLLLISSAGSAGAATIDELLASESRARQQRDTPAPVAAPIEFLSTTFEVDGIFGVENQIYADVRYNGESSRVVQGDRLGPCVVSQIAGTLGTGVQLQLAPPAPAKNTGKGTRKAAKPDKPAKPNPASRCPIAYWTEPRKSEPANAPSFAASANPVIPSITAGIPPGIPAAPAPAITVIPQVKKN